ncbi:cysteine hydrolase family protein [Curtobacterium ammoniigenes]|uniref:cysteine hydrolase family protein n=1 Tax=Curtobacterium ammoniigenes TaxID=395387 RepID=UPI00082B4804|nr:isochorismatase family cysteine hydrolase [Curtobacterium ammoniigenes]
MTGALPSMNPTTTAVVTIDLHRGHLDPSVATMPLPTDAAAELTVTAARALDRFRALGIPVIHVVTSYFDVGEISANPWWSTVAGTSATRGNVLRHQLPGSPGLELMSELLAPEDITISTKKRYDSFQATELQFLLETRNIETLLIMGVNTNSCVLATTVAANARDYAAVVLEDCVDTMDRSMHDTALGIIRQAFGWTATAEETLEELRSHRAIIS